MIIYEIYTDDTEFLHFTTFLSNNNTYKLVIFSKEVLYIFVK